MIKEVELVTIKILNQKKDGTPFKNKKGEPFEMAMIKTKCGIEASKYLDQKFGAKAREEIVKWKPNDKLKLKITKEGEYTNFDIPNQKDIEIAELRSEIEELKEWKDKINKFLKSKFQ